jgi:hypothetical protein
VVDSAFSADPVQKVIDLYADEYHEITNSSASQALNTELNTETDVNNIKDNLIERVTAFRGFISVLKSEVYNPELVSQMNQAKQTLSVSSEAYQHANSGLLSAIRSADLSSAMTLLETFEASHASYKAAYDSFNQIARIRKSAIGKYLSAYIVLTEFLAAEIQEHQDVSILLTLLGLRQRNFNEFTIAGSEINEEMGRWLV